jgi:hypothetical protein
LFKKFIIMTYAAKPADTVYASMDSEIVSANDGEDVVGSSMPSTTVRESTPEPVAQSAPTRRVNGPDAGLLEPVEKYKLMNDLLAEEGNLIGSGVWPDIPLYHSDKTLAARFSGYGQQRSTYYLRQGGDVTNLSVNPTLVTFSTVGINRLLAQGPAYAARAMEKVAAYERGDMKGSNAIILNKIVIDELVETGTRHYVMMTPYFFKDPIPKIMINFKVTSSINGKSHTFNEGKGITLTVKCFVHMLNVVLPLLKRCEKHMHTAIECIRESVDKSANDAAAFNSAPLCSFFAGMPNVYDVYGD